MIAPRPFVNANQYATSFGGPIKKDKSFFFVDYEGIRLVIPSLFSVNLPTQQFENAVIANLNSVSPASVPFYNQLFGIWNATPGAARAPRTLSRVGVVRTLPAWRESHSEQATRVPSSCRAAHRRPPMIT